LSVFDLWASFSVYSLFVQNCAFASHFRDWYLDRRCAGPQAESLAESLPHLILSMVGGEGFTTRMAATEFKEA
jgi:hypothetical protein